MKFSIGAAIFDSDRRTLSIAGQCVELEPRVADVLLHFAQRPGQVVAREDVLSAVWKTQFISDDVLTRCVNIIRRIFNDDAKLPQILETVTKRGYRMIADVKSLDEVPEKGLSVLGPRFETGMLKARLHASILNAGELLSSVEPVLTMVHPGSHLLADAGGARWRRGRFCLKIAPVGEHLQVRFRLWDPGQLAPVLGAMIGYLIGSRALSGSERGGLMFGLALIGTVAGAAFGYWIARRSAKALHNRLQIEWYILIDAFRLAGFDVAPSAFDLDQSPQSPERRQ